MIYTQFKITRMPQHTECSICLEHTDPEKDVTLSCDHMFHHSCAIGWLVGNDTCPMCRKSIGITTKTNNQNSITLYNNDSHIMDTNDLNRLYHIMIDIVNTDETNPTHIQWNSSNSIQWIIKGGQKKNKKIITYQISKHRNQYIVCSIYVDFWKYPSKYGNTKYGNNRKYGNRKYGNNRKYGRKQF